MTCIYLYVHYSNLKDTNPTMHIKIKARRSKHFKINKIEKLTVIQFHFSFNSYYNSSSTSNSQSRGGGGLSTVRSSINPESQNRQMWMRNTGS